MRWRGSLHATGSGLRTPLRLIPIATWLLVLTGADKRLEAARVDAAPAWLAAITTSL